MISTRKGKSQLVATESDEWIESSSDPFSSTSTSTSTGKHDSDYSDDSSYTTEETSQSPGNSTTTITSETSILLCGQKPKKQKGRWRTICTTLCRYDVVRKVAKQVGLREVNEDKAWMILWMDCSISYGKVTDLKRYQKINHFPGMIEICRKDLLARNLNRMRKLFPREYNIYPRSWCLPADFSEIISTLGKKKRTLICKPDTGCQGKGIVVVKSVQDINPTVRTVVQEYISKPFLIDGYKFDLRVYVLITAVEPEFRIYVFKEGLARFATVKYEPPEESNMENMCMHLTNYAVNKHSDNFVYDDVAGSKRKLSSIEKWWDEHMFDKAEIWQNMDDAIIKTIISASAVLKHNYRTCFPNHVGVNACFEILGFDILLDTNLKPYVLEVNLSPSFNIDSELDKEVKEGLIRNTFELLDLKSCNPKKCEEEDRKKARSRLLAGRASKSREQMRLMQQEVAQDGILSLEIFELQHMNNYRLIYPVHTHTEKYRKFFHYNTSLYQDTVASKAREECSKIMRENIFKKTRYNMDLLASAQRKDQTKIVSVTASKLSTRSAGKPLKKRLPRRVQPRLQPRPRIPLHPQVQTLESPFFKDDVGNLISGIPTYVFQPEENRELTAPNISSRIRPESLEDAETNLPAYYVNWRDSEMKLQTKPNDLHKPGRCLSTDNYLNLPLSTKLMPSAKHINPSPKGDVIQNNENTAEARSELASNTGSHVRMTRAHLARTESNFAKIRSHVNRIAVQHR